MLRNMKCRDIDLASIRDVYCLAMGFAIKKLNKDDKREDISFLKFKINTEFIFNYYILYDFISW